MSEDFIPEQRRDTREIFGGFLPKPAGLGSIKALAELGAVLKANGNDILFFDAGLPDHARPQEVKNNLMVYAEMDHADYSRYPRLEGQISEALVFPLAAKYHADVIGIHRSQDRFALAEGSTPILDILIKMMTMQKARTDGKALGKDCGLETFQLSYPLYKIPAEDVVMTVSRSMFIETTLDVVDGQPIQPEPWKLNKQSVIDSFKHQRDNFQLSVFVFSSPANPSGYKLSNDETDFLAEEILRDYKLRRERNLPAKLVIEDIAYITMMHDDEVRPYTLVHAFERMIAEENRKRGAADKQLLSDLTEAMSTVVTVHSLSKAAGEAGDRVAYAEGDETIISQVREAWTRMILSYANASLYAAKGAFEAGPPSREVMSEYSRRVKALEGGMNEAYFSLIEREDIALSAETIRETMPFPARSGGSFFTVMNLKPLIGQKVSDEFISQVQAYIDQIGNEGIRRSFGNIFVGGRINESDLPLYLMMKTLEYGGTAVSCVPLQDGMVRFAAGITPVADVKKAVAATKEFMLRDPAYLTGVKEIAAKFNSPSSTVESVKLFKIQSGVARSVA